MEAISRIVQRVLRLLKNSTHFKNRPSDFAALGSTECLTMDYLKVSCSHELFPIRYTVHWNLRVTDTAGQHWIVHSREVSFVQSALSITCMPLVSKFSAEGP